MVLLDKVVIVALGYMLCIAFVFRNDGSLRTWDGDPQEPCAHPLRAYAWASLVLAAYTPYHMRLLVRFNYVAGTVHDEIFQMLVWLFLCTGTTLVWTCRKDVIEEAVSRGDVVTKTGVTSDGAMFGDDGQDSSNDPSVAHALNACQATCPDLTDAVVVYMTALALFMLSVILPLLFLPRILQQQLRDNDNDEDDDLMFSFTHGSIVTAEKILQNMQNVKLVRQSEGNVRVVPTTTTTADSPNDTTTATTTTTTTWAAEEGTLECCICMTEFHIYNDDIEAGDIEEQEHGSVVRTPVCGHLLHEQCIAGWVGGRWERSISNETLRQNRQRRARCTTCPLCRAELQRGVGRAQRSYNTF